MAFWCHHHALHVVNSIKKIWHLQVRLYLHVFASTRITHSLMSWLCIYIWSIGETLIPQLELMSLTLWKCSFIVFSILGNSPSSIKNPLTQNTAFICCQHNGILSLCCSIHHNTLTLKLIQIQHGTFFQPIVPPFNTYFNWDIIYLYRCQNH